MRCILNGNVRPLLEAWGWVLEAGGWRTDRHGSIARREPLAGLLQRFNFSTTFGTDAPGRDGMGRDGLSTWSACHTSMCSSMCPIPSLSRPCVPSLSHSVRPVPTECLVHLSRPVLVSALSRPCPVHLGIQSARERESETESFLPADARGGRSRAPLWPPCLHVAVPWTRGAMHAARSVPKGTVAPGPF